MKNKVDYSIEKMCKAIGVSCSSYYSWICGTELRETKEQYQKAGSFQNGYHICLGGSNKGVAGSVFSLVVDNNCGDNLGNGLFSVRRQI